MATETAVETSFFEKIGEKLNAATEGFVNFLGRLFGSSNEREIRKFGYERSSHPEQPYRIIAGSILDRINQHEPQMQVLSDVELKELTPKFRARLKEGETLEDLLPEAFAACREAGRRAKKMRHYDVQMIGGIVLHGGNIAEMVTGEGKTLVATLPAYLNALTGEGVHVITVNDYLARRDCEWMLPIYQALGITAGYIQSDMESAERRRAYDCDITYGTNSEFGFDYLRDNMKPARWADENYPTYLQQCQRALNYAIIDEVDNILIDEARTPLIISGPAHRDTRRYEDANRIALQLTDLQRREPGKYFEVKEKEHTCHLTDDGIRKAEELAGVESFYTPGNMEWPHLIDNALKAHHLYQKDKKYMVMHHEGEKRIVIIDEFTGRPMFGRQWSDGLHQAIEAKHKNEGVQIKQETQTLATITLQNYFKLYKKLAGMTGTAMTEADEFWKIYKLNVVAIPTNKPLRRVNSADLIYRTEREKWDAVVDEVVRVNSEGRPILIGTTDVAKSEKLSDMLKRRGIKYELLNAKPENVAREAEIVAQAGRRGAVTIATNMAGRGTDIILGGNPETLAWAELKQKKDADGRPLYPTRLEVLEEVWKETVNRIEAREKMKAQGEEIKELGGLHIIGTERHESRRIDNQLRGRSGRQGDPGSSRFFVSLQDDLMRIFAGEWVANWLTRLGMQEGEPIESNLVTRQIQKAQKKVEEMHFDQRKNLLEYDEVMDHQRKQIYGTRQRILDGMNCKRYILEMIDEQLDEALNRYLDGEYGAATFAEYARNRVGEDFDASDFRGMTFEEADRFVKDKVIRMVETHIQEAMEENLNADEDPKDWKWQEMARVINTRYGLKLIDRELKKIGREALVDYLLEQCTLQVEQFDLSDGRPFLEDDWGLRSLSDWVRNKFTILLSPDELSGKDRSEIHQQLSNTVRMVYRERDILFPVLAAMSQYLADHTTTPNAVKYDREGLLNWAKERFPGQSVGTEDDTFRTLSRSQCRDLILQMSRGYYPEMDQEAIDDKVGDALSGTRHAEHEDALELGEWFKTATGIEVAPERLVGETAESITQTLWNEFDFKYRREMRSVERRLILDILDAAWKTHLLTMDHLRAGIGLMAYGQIDPKTEYKRQGMKEFEAMWESMQDRVSDAVFRVESIGGAEVLQDALWAGASASHAEAQSISSMRAQQSQQAQGTANTSEAKKPEPIRNLNKKVGRNDPCPCGSGKKYKNCHMGKEATRT